MNCRELEKHLTDYHDGELPPDLRQEVDRHLEDCASCRAELDREREVVRLAREWHRDAEPERDLWPAIEAGIRARPGRVLRGRWTARHRVALAAAAALIAAVTLVAVRQPDTPRAADVGVSEPSPAPPVGNLSLALASERARAEGGLMHVREDLLRTIHQRRGELDDETQEMVDRNLRIIDLAIGEIYQALEEDPENMVLEQLLAATHQREAEFLKQINTL